MKPIRKIVPGQYPLGLSVTQEARAARLHRESIVIDLLSQHAGGNIFAHYPAQLRAEFNARMDTAGAGLDALSVAIHWPYLMSKLGKSDLILQWFQTAGLTCGTYGIEVSDGQNQHAETSSAVLGNTDLPWLQYVTTAAEIRQAKREGRIAFYAHCQPVSPAPRNLKAFDFAYAKGLRSFMLTYNQMDNIGVGCTERVDAGLSMFGVDAVAHCNKIGMIVDVSHCGYLTTLDACRHSKKPVNANHTSAKSISGHARSKSDEELRAIAGTGGVIGVVALPSFLSRSANLTIEIMLDHIEYIAALVGWRHVALGSDWPIQAPDDVLRRIFTPMLRSIGFKEEDQFDTTSRLIGFDDCRDLPNITRGLVKRGLSDEQIQGILGENALRVFADVFGG